MTKTRPGTEVSKPGSRRVAGGVAAPKLPKPPANRAERTAERRAAIIEAALDEFIARGFAATRLDDVAKRAGVAKGTIYLHFKDKESLFEELIRTAIVPLVGRMHGPPPLGAIGSRCDRGLCARPSSRRLRRRAAATSCA